MSSTAPGNILHTGRPDFIHEIIPSIMLASRAHPAMTERARPEIQTLSAAAVLPWPAPYIPKPAQSEPIDAAPMPQQLTNNQPDHVRWRSEPLRDRAYSNGIRGVI